MGQRDINRKSVICWLLWLLAFAVLEAIGLRGSNRWTTLTRVTRRFVPETFTYAFIAWLFFHAVETYHTED